MKKKSLMIDLIIFSLKSHFHHPCPKTWKVRISGEQNQIEENEVSFLSLSF